MNVSPCPRAAAHRYAMEDAKNAAFENNVKVVAVTAFIALASFLANAAAERACSSLGAWWVNCAKDWDTFACFRALLVLVVQFVYVEVSIKSLVPLVLGAASFSENYGIGFWGLDRVAWCFANLAVMLFVFYSGDILAFPTWGILHVGGYLVEEVQKEKHWGSIGAVIALVAYMWYHGINPIKTAAEIRKKWKEDQEARDVQQGPFVSRSLFKAIRGYFYWCGATIVGFLTVPPPGEQRRAAGALAAGAPAAGAREPAPAQSALAPAPAPSSPTARFAPPPGGIRTPPRPAISSS